MQIYTYLGFNTCFLRAGITPGSQQQSDMGSVQLQVVDVQYMGTLCSEWFFLVRSEHV